MSRRYPGWRAGVPACWVGRAASAARRRRMQEPRREVKYDAKRLSFRQLARLLSDDDGRECSLLLMKVAIRGHAPAV